MKNKKARKLVEEVYPLELMASVCSSHNISRCADTLGARAALLQKRVDKFGRQHMETVLEEIRDTFKGNRPELRLSALLACS